MAISSIGVGSGLPIDQILTDLQKVESRPLELISNRQAIAESRLSAYGVLKSSLEGLNNAAKALSDPATFGAMKSQHSSDAFSVTVDNKAVAGKYQIHVTELATSQTLVAQGRADRTENIGTDGVITLHLANGETRELDLTGQSTSLDGLLSAINADPDLGIQATLVNDGSGTPHRLLLTATQTGTEASVARIEVSGNSELADLLAYDSAAAPEDNAMDAVAAKNAALTVNGIAVTSQTNDIEGVIEGVTLRLDKTTDAAVSVQISRDDTVATKAIQSFVSAYNSLQSIIGSLTNYDQDANRASVLTGDSLARNVQNSMRSAINMVAQSGNIVNLSSVGISTDIQSGMLKVDEAVLAKAVKDDLAGVQSLFSGEQGVGKVVQAAADRFLRSDGLIKVAEDGARSTVKDLKEQHEMAAERVAASIERYRQQFVALDKIVAQMNGVSSYLTQQLAMLNNLSSQSSKK